MRARARPRKPDPEGNQRTKRARGKPNGARREPKGSKLKPRGAKGSQRELQGTQKGAKREPQRGPTSNNRFNLFLRNPKVEKLQTSSNRKGPNVALVRFLIGRD